MNAPSDRLLAQRASGGDVLAFEVLVRRYQLRLLRLCVGMLGDRHAGEEAAQDVFFGLSVDGPVPGATPSFFDVAIPDSHKPMLAGHPSASGADCALPELGLRKAQVE